MSVSVGGFPSRPQVDFGWLSDGWSLFKRQSGAWIVAALLAGAIDLAVGGVLSSLFGENGTRSGASTGVAGILVHYVPDSPLQAVASLVDYLVTSLLSAGLFRMAFRQIRGERIGPFDFLAIGDVLVPLLGAGAIVWACTCLGYVLCVVPGLILDGLFLFAPLYVVAEGAGPVEAVSASVNALKGQWLMATVYVCLAGLWVIASFCLCGVGELAVIPQVVLAAAVGFARFGGGGALSALPPVLPAPAELSQAGGTGSPRPEGPDSPSPGTARIPRESLRSAQNGGRSGSRKDRSR